MLLVCALLSPVPARVLMRNPREDGRHSILLPRPMRFGSQLTLMGQRKGHLPDSTCLHHLLFRRFLVQLVVMALCTSRT